MSEPKSESSSAAAAVPFPACLRYDILAGFLVFLIALPLCLAIGRASGFPPIGGVITAIVGGILASMISNSELTIKGPAAGLIAIVAACVADMAKLDTSGSPYPGYQYALAVGVTAAVFQILFGLFKAGKLGDFFPTAAVHGLLASIGVMIIIKQILGLLGVTKKQPIEISHLIMEYHHYLADWNPLVTVVGLVSLAIIIVLPLLKIKALKVVPIQLIVLVVAIPLAIFIGIQRAPKTVAAAPAPAAKAEEKPAPPPPAAEAAKPAETKPAADHGHAAAPAAKPEVFVNPYKIGEKSYNRDGAKYLINVPLKITEWFQFPSFKVGNKSLFAEVVFWKWVLMFAIIASLESLLSAKAVDLIDPQRRKTDLNRDLLACGIANLVASCIGGLPMISEIVRSRANVDNGAKTRFSNVSHAVFLLLFAALLPFLLNMIPISALAAMLCFTGFRLAHPREFLHMLQVGWEQLTVFVVTIVAVVCTDLLIGVLIGMALKLVINLIRGCPLTSLFSSGAELTKLDEKSYLITVKHAVVFTNWIPLRGKIEQFGLKQKMNIVLDLSNAELVDHTVMEKLHELEREFKGAGLKFEVQGLDGLVGVSQHPAAARIRSLAVAAH